MLQSCIRTAHDVLGRRGKRKGKNTLEQDNSCPNRPDLLPHMHSEQGRANIRSRSLKHSCKHFCGTLEASFQQIPIQKLAEHFSTLEKCSAKSYAKYILSNYMSIKFVDLQVNSLMMQWKSLLKKVVTRWQLWQLQATYKPPQYTSISMHTQSNMKQKYSSAHILHWIVQTCMPVPSKEQKFSNFRSSCTLKLHLSYETRRCGGLRIDIDHHGIFTCA